MILDAAGRPLDVHLDTDQIAKLMAEEIRRLREPAILAMPPIEAMQIAGIVQLALRHPQFPDSHRAAAAAILGGVREYFAECPTILDILHHGDNPAEDVPRG
jgi:hypothetical protein